jgi:cysteine-rich repeat protein
MAKAYSVGLNALLFSFYAFRAFFYTAAAVAQNALQFLVQFVLGAGGRILWFFFLLAVLGAINTRHQSRVDEKLNDFYCETKPVRTTINEAISVVEPFFPPIICIWNLYMSWSAVLLQVFLKYTFECANLGQFLRDLKDFIAAVLESYIKFVFTDQSVFGNNFDFAAIWKAYQKLSTNGDPVFACLCNDLVPVYAFARDFVTTDALGCAISNTLNAGIQLVQELYDTIVGIIQAASGLLVGQTVSNPFRPSVFWLKTTCAAGQCIGSQIDFVIGRFIGFFVDNPPPIAIGCTLGELFCVLTSYSRLWLLNIIDLFWAPTTWNPFTNSDFSDLILHLNDTGKCVDDFFSIFDDCLGDATGNAVRFSADLLDFVVTLIQQGEFKIGILTDSLNRFLGQARWGSGVHVGLFGAHNKINRQNQTSLTCFVARLTDLATTTGFESCNLAIADYMNSVGQLFILPFEFLQTAVDQRNLTSSVAGNPLSPDTIENFELYIRLLLDSIVNRVFGLLDYLAHIFQCVDILKKFGTALVKVVQNIRNVFVDIETLFILALEFVVETIILIITLIAGPLFDGSSFNEELGIFASVLARIFTLLAELVIDIIKRLLNLGIFFFFPALFGQSTLYADPNSPATFTQCVEDFIPDCICGLVYSITKDICLPLKLGCIGDWLPGCGIFQTTPSDVVPSGGEPVYGTTWSTNSNRRRSLPTVDAREDYNTMFEYFADEFGGPSFCGTIFERYRNVDIDNKPKIGEFDVATYLGCIGVMRVSVEYAEAHDLDVHPRYLMDESRVVNSSTEFMRGATVAALTGVTNLAFLTRDPEAAIGQPSATQPLYVTLEEKLAENNVTDSLAVDALRLVANLTSIAHASFTEVMNDPKQINPNGTISQMARVGALGLKLAGVTLATGKLLGNEIWSSGALSDFGEGITDVVSSVDWGKIESTLSPRKRQYDKDIRAPWFPQHSTEQEPSQEITKAHETMFFIQRARLASAAYGGLLYGPYLEALARRNMDAAEAAGMTLMQFGQPKISLEHMYNGYAPYGGGDDITPQGFVGLGRNERRRGLFENVAPLDPAHPYVMLDTDEVYLNVSYIYGTNGLIDFTDHIPNSCGVLHMKCDVANLGPLAGCDYELEVETLGLCQSFPGNRGVVMQCGDDFSAVAVYATADCKPENSPLFIRITNATIPVQCFNIQTAPAGLVNDFYCIRYDECRACAINKVLPGFECRYADDVVHRMKYLSQRCLVLFIGAIKPPFNFSYFIPVPTTPTFWEYSGNRTTVFTTLPERVNTTCVRSVCGDGIRSDEVYRAYVNDTYFILKACEECDDANRRSYDGCSQFCKIEKCGVQIIRQKIALDFNAPCNATAIDATLKALRYPSPQSCLRDEGNRNKTRQYNCKSQTPVVFSFDNQLCTTPVGSSRLIYKDTCDYNCIYASGAVCDILHRDLSCQPCAVCGNGLVDGDEICDDDPYFGTTCVDCEFKAVPCDLTFQTCLGYCRGPGLGPGSARVTCIETPTLPAGCPPNTSCVFTSTNPPTPSPPVCAALHDSSTGICSVNPAFVDLFCDICYEGATAFGRSRSWEPYPNDFLKGLRNPITDQFFQSFFIPCGGTTIRLYSSNNAARTRCESPSAVVELPLPFCGETTWLFPPGPGGDLLINTTCPLGFSDYVGRKREAPVLVAENRTLEDQWRMLSHISLVADHAVKAYASRRRGEPPTLEEALRYALGPEPEIPTQPTSLQKAKRSDVYTPQLVPKDSWMETWFIDRFQRIYNYVLSRSETNTAGDFIDDAEAFFTSTDVSAYADPRGAAWYLVFPFWCRNPENLDGSLGQGLVPAIVSTATWFGLVLLFLTFGIDTLPAAFISILMLVGVQIFLGVAYGYSLSCWFLGMRIPEQSVTGILNLTREFNGTCIGFMQPAALSPCTDACSQVMTDCRTVGFVDGFDTIIALLEFYIPAASHWLRTSATAERIRNGIVFIGMFDGFDIIESYDKALVNFDLMGAPATSLQKYCLWRTFPMFTQPFVFMILDFFTALPPILILLVLAESIFWLVYAFGRILVDLFATPDLSMDDVAEYMDDEEKAALKRKGKGKAE